MSDKTVPTLPTESHPNTPILNPDSITNTTADIKQFYTFDRKIGEAGQFGYAVIATKHSDNKQYAVKVVNKNKFSSMQQRRAHYKELQTEINILKQLKHKHIIHFYETYETDSTLYIVTELCSGGELFDEIKQLGNYTELHASRVLQQCISGLSYLHEHKVAHCDLKPDNFLFSDKTEHKLIKIIDFGMSKHLLGDKRLHSLRGTPYYIAPEVIQGSYEFSADMWSIGVVMFVMLFGYPPFSADTDDGIFQQILAGFHPITQKGYKAHFPIDIPCSDSAKDLMSKLLTKDTTARLTADEALLHPWLLGETCTTDTISTIVLNNLRSFTANTKLKQRLLQLMAQQLNTTDLAGIKQQFELIDANHDGYISLQELKAVLQRDDIHIDNSEIEQLYHNADIDGDGVLKYNELVQLTVHHRLMSKRERLYELFNQLDVDKNGEISAAELQHVLNSTESDALDMVKDIDTDDDGTIDLDEFVNAWTNKKIQSIEQKLQIPLANDTTCDTAQTNVSADHNVDQHRRHSYNKKDCIVQ